MLVSWLLLFLLMSLITLTRTSQSPDLQLGALNLMGVTKFVTIERPWLFNKRNVSCIPTGHYDCVLLKRADTNFGARGQFESCEHFILVQRVPNRSGIFFHPANTVDDVQGCIGAGLFFGEIGNDEDGFVDAVMESTVAHNQLCAWLLEAGVKPSQDTFQLTVR